MTAPAFIGALAVLVCCVLAGLVIGPVQLGVGAVAQALAAEVPGLGIHSPLSATLLVKFPTHKWRPCLFWPVHHLSRAPYGWRVDATGQ